MWSARSIDCMEDDVALSNAVHTVAVEIEEYVARQKLASMGIQIDTLTKDQQNYLSGWEHGT